MLTPGTRLATPMVIAVCLGVAGCGGRADKAGGAKDQHPVLLHVLNTRGAGEIRPFADKVADLSKGALRLTLDNKWEGRSTTSEPDAIRAIQAGRADLAIVPARAWHGVGVTSFDALIAPLTVDSMALQQKVLEGDMPHQMLAGLKPLGLVGIGILPGPMRKPDGITRPLLSPSDYRGATIGYSPSAVADRALRVLGALPVGSAFEHADISAFDGIEQQVASTSGNQYDGTVKAITENVNLWPRPLVIFAGAKSSRLSDQQLSWLRAAASDSVDATARAQMQNDTDALELMCHRGKVDFTMATPAQVAHLRSAFQPVYTWLRGDEQTRRFLDEIQAVRAGGITPYPAEALRCAGHTAAPTESTSPVSPIDGAWKVTTTLADLRAAGTPLEDQVPDNYGVSRLVLGKGRFAITGHNGPAACAWAYGTYVVTGKQIELTFTAGGGVSAVGAFNQKGELFEYFWSAYRGAMTWSAVPGAISPPGWTAKPWHLISKQPSARYLDPMCPPPAVALTG